MLEQLAKPPLVEAVCEFRFDVGEQWDWTAPGRLYDLIGEEFPHKEQVPSFGFSLKIDEGAQTVASTAQGVPDRVVMRREDGSALVQVGPHLLVVNHLLPYPGWETYFALIWRILETYLKLAPSSSFQRIGLRYINRIPAPLENSVEISSFITLDPPIPDAIDRPLANFYQRYELRHDDPVGILVHQTGMQLTEEENNGALVLDLDFGSLPSAVPQVADARPWLWTAHDRIEEAFLASVNPDLLSRMKKGD